MRKHIKVLLLILAVTSVFAACKKEDVDVPNPITPIPITPVNNDTTGPLKSATTIPIGFAINYNSFINNNAYRDVVVREANSVTFENEMKHSSIVQNNGTYNFATTDAFVNAATSAGLNIFGHVLGWHTQQNASYIKTFAEINSTSGPELLSNGGFESGLTGWSTLNTANGATVVANTLATDARSGSGSMKVVNPVANPGEQWRVQVASPVIATTVGKQYLVSYWVKAESAGGFIRLSTQDQNGGNAQYQGNQSITTSYSQISYSFTATTAQTRFLFDLGQAANTYYIDDVSMKEVITQSGGQVATKVDQALNNWITAIVSRYKDKVKAWDVVNELFTENGNIRNNANTTNFASDVFMWSEYLGRDYALKAFNYAKAADPNALLFINDYNLEANNTAKLDSFVAFVNELKTKGAKIDGVGTQMHISINTSRNAIDNMFRKLASSGLKVRISELDIRVNPNDLPDATFTSTLATQQSDMYHFVVSSYLKIVPIAQQHGITVWGVDDASSWIVQSQRKSDFPLLFDRNFIKKLAYYGFLKALKGK